MCYFISFYLEFLLLPYCLIGLLLRPMGWGLSGVAVEVPRALCSLSCDRSVEWLELSWHLKAWAKGGGLGRDEAEAQWRRTKERLPSRTVNRWKVPRRSWWRGVAGRCWHCHPTGAGRSCGLSQRKDSLCWELERESKRRSESERELNGKEGLAKNKKRIGNQSSWNRERMEIEQKHYEHNSVYTTSNSLYLLYWFNLHFKLRVFESSSS